MPAPDFMDKQKREFEDELRYFTVDEMAFAVQQGHWYNGRPIGNWRLDCMRKEVEARNKHGVEMRVRGDKPAVWHMMQEQRRKAAEKLAQEAAAAKLAEEAAARKAEEDAKKALASEAALAEERRLQALFLKPDGTTSEPPKSVALEARERVGDQFMVNRSVWDRLKKPDV